MFDSSWIVNVGEFASYVQLQKRAMKLNHVLMGYYETPGRVDKPLQLVVNPQSADARLQERVWNVGVWHCISTLPLVQRGPSTASWSCVGAAGIGCGELLQARVAPSLHVGNESVLCSVQPQTAKFLARLHTTTPVRSTAHRVCVYLKCAD